MKYLLSRTLKTACGASVPRVKRPCREVDHSPPSIATIIESVLPNLVRFFVMCYGESSTFTQILCKNWNFRVFMMYVSYKKRHPYSLVFFLFFGVGGGLCACALVPERD